MFSCLFYKCLVNQLEDKLLLLRHQQREGEEEMSPHLEEIELLLLVSLENGLSSSVSSLGVLLGAETKLRRALLIYLLSFPFGHFDKLKEPSWL